MDLSTIRGLYQTYKGHVRHIKVRKCAPEASVAKARHQMHSVCCRKKWSDCECYHSSKHHTPDFDIKTSFTEARNQMCTVCCHTDGLSANATSAVGTTHQTFNVLTTQ